MTKTKQGICIAAMLAALSAPAARADEGQEWSGVFAVFIGQVEAWLLGDEEPPAADTGAVSDPFSGDLSEVSYNVPVGG